MDFDKDTWTIIDSYFRDNKNYLVKHHLDSFNDFIGNKIPLILQQYNPQVHVKELIPETDLYKYETHVYFGGEDGSEVFLIKWASSENSKITDAIKTQIGPDNVEKAKAAGLTINLSTFVEQVMGTDFVGNYMIKK